MSDTEIQVTEPTEQAAPEVDLSALPEKVRGHINTDKYSSDEGYKRAADHGWTPLDVWVAEGRDEGDWVNYNAFNKNYDDWQYKKELKDEAKRATKEAERAAKAAEALIGTFEQDKQRAIEDALAQREAELKIAIQDNDAAKAVKLQSEIMDTRREMSQKQPAPVLHPVIADFIDNNPVINPEAPDFNKEYADSIWNSATQLGNDLQRQFRRELSPLEVEACLQRAMKMNKAPEKKPVQKAPVVNAPSQKPSNAAPKLNGIQKQIYNKLLDSKNGKQKAEMYLKQLSAN